LVYSLIFGRPDHPAADARQICRERANFGKWLKSGDMAKPAR